MAEGWRRGVVSLRKEDEGRREKERLAGPSSWLERWIEEGRHYMCGWCLGKMRIGKMRGSFRAAISEVQIAVAAVAGAVRQPKIALPCPLADLHVKTTHLIGSTILRYGFDTTNASRRTPHFCAGET